MHVIQKVFVKRLYLPWIFSRYSWKAHGVVNVCITHFQGFPIVWLKDVFGPYITLGPKRRPINICSYLQLKKVRWLNFSTEFIPKWQPLFLCSIMLIDSFGSFVCKPFNSSFFPFLSSADFSSYFSVISNFSFSNLSLPETFSLYYQLEMISYHKCSLCWCDQLVAPAYFHKSVWVLITVTVLATMSISFFVTSVRNGNKFLVSKETVLSKSFTVVISPLSTCLIKPNFCMSNAVMNI